MSIVIQHVRALYTMIRWLVTTVVRTYHTPCA